MIFRLFKKTEIKNTYELHIQLNDKIMPIDRGDLYEDPLIDLLNQKEFGEVVNSGTMQLETKEIAFCDITVQINNYNIDKKDIIDSIITFLENKGAPKESFIIDVETNNKIYFGKLEGLGIYLDGVNLPTNVYSECDINYVVSELKRLLNLNDDIIRYWQGPTETALYFYNLNFEEMKSKIKNFVDSYPLCQNSRITRIA